MGVEIMNVCKKCGLANPGTKEEFDVLIKSKEHICRCGVIRVELK